MKNSCCRSVLYQKPSVSSLRWEISPIKFIGEKLESNKNSNVRLLGVRAAFEDEVNLETYFSGSEHWNEFLIFPRNSRTSRSNSWTAENTSADYFYFSLDLTLLVISGRASNEPWKKGLCSRIKGPRCCFSLRRSVVFPLEFEMRNLCTCRAKVARECRGESDRFKLTL